MRFPPKEDNPWQWKFLIWPRYIVFTEGEDDNDDNRRFNQTLWLEWVEVKRDHPHWRDRLGHMVFPWCFAGVG